jgi:hypothetical protein
LVHSSGRGGWWRVASFVEVATRLAGWLGLSYLGQKQCSNMNELVIFITA